MIVCVSDTFGVLARNHLEHGTKRPFHQNHIWSAQKASLLLCPVSSKSSRFAAINGVSSCSIPPPGSDKMNFCERVDHFDHQ